MRRKTAVILGVSGAALALTASSAFTAGGLTITPTTGFIGGSASQTIAGTTVSSVAYTRDTSDTANLGTIVYTFSDGNAAGKRPSITLTSGGSPVTNWGCGLIASSSPYTATCSKSANSASGTDVPISGLTAVELTVS